MPIADRGLWHLRNKNLRVAQHHQLKFPVTLEFQAGLVGFEA
jgi:hypothetical protein